MIDAETQFGSAKVYWRLRCPRSWATMRPPCFGCGGRSAAKLEPEDLSANLIVQLGLGDRGPEPALVSSATPARRSRMCSGTCSIPSINWMAATLDGLVDAGPARCSKPNSCCPGRSRKKPPPKSTWRSCSTTCGSPTRKSAVLSIITGGGKWVEITIHADPLYQHLLLTAEKKFWRCVMSGETPRLFGVEPPRPRHRGGPDRRYERLQLLGGVRGGVPPDPAGLSGARGRQG